MKLAIALTILVIMGALCAREYKRLMHLFTLEAQMRSMVSREIRETGRARRHTDRYRLERQAEKLAYTSLQQ